MIDTVFGNHIRISWNNIIMLINKWKWYIWEIIHGSHNEMKHNWYKFAWYKNLLFVWNTHFFFINSTRRKMLFCLYFNNFEFFILILFKIKKFFLNFIIDKINQNNLVGYLRNLKSMKIKILISWFLLFNSCWDFLLFFYFPKLKVIL